MSSANRDRNALSFAYHGQALGLSASLLKPQSENIPSLGIASLSSTGGESHSTIRNYHWKGLISFSEASAFATGSFDHGAYNTLATVTVKDLNIANMVHADLIVGRVTSRHVPGDPEAHITFTGSTIRNLVVAGRETDVVLDDAPFLDNPTYAGFTKKLGSARSKDRRFVNEKTQVVSASLATTVGGADGFTIDIPEFGTIYVAQVLMKPSYRRISMLRFKLGCPVAGQIEVAAAETNGVEYWP